MADAMSAASLLVAILAVLFAAWIGDIVSAIRIDVEALRANRRPQRRLMMNALLSKALPLTVGAWLVALIFAPRSFGLAQSIFTCRGGCKFDDVGAAFVLMEAFAALIVVTLSVQTTRLVLKLVVSFGPDR
jgi:hypothetical protein